MRISKLILRSFLCGLVGILLATEATRSESATFDEGAPDILQFSVSAQILEGQPYLNFSVKLSENFEANTISLLFWLEDAEQTWLSVPRDLATGLYSMTYALNEYAASGTYAVRAIVMTDVDGNSVRLNEGQLQTLGFSTKTELLNLNEDGIAPTLTSITSTGWYFDSDDVPKIVFDVSASDDGSGLQTGMIVELLSPSGSSIQKRGSFDDDGAATVGFALSKYAASGKYRINTVRIYDSAGNNTYAQKELAENPRIYILNNPNSDEQVSSLESFELSASFDNSSDRPIINVSGRAKDSPSGVQSVYLRLTTPDNNRIDKWITDRQSDINLSFSNQIAMTTKFTEGKYLVDFLRLIDVAKNEKYLRWSDLAANPIDYDSSLNIFFPTVADVATGDTVVFASDEADFVFGANASDDQLFGGGGDDEIYSGAGNDEVNAGAGDDLIIGGSGEGDDLYDGADGVDEVSFTSAEQSIVVDLHEGRAYGDEIGSDMLIDIENITSGHGSDFLRGNDGANLVRSGDGDDVIFASGGADVVYGGAGVDSFVYSNGAHSTAASADTLHFDSSDVLVLSTKKAYPVRREIFTGSLSSAITNISVESSYDNSIVFLTKGRENYLLAKLHGVDAVLTNLLVRIVSSDAPKIEFVEYEDTDNDGTPNVLTLDDDGDGTPDVSDVANVGLTFTAGVLGVEAVPNVDYTGRVEWIDARLGNRDTGCFVEARLEKDVGEAGGVASFVTELDLGSDYPSGNFGVIDDTPRLRLTDGTSVYDGDEYFVYAESLSSLARNYAVESADYVLSPDTSEVAINITVSGFPKDETFLAAYSDPTDRRLKAHIHLADGTSYVGHTYMPEDVSEVSPGIFRFSSSHRIQKRVDHRDPKIQVLSICESSTHRALWEADFDLDGSADGIQLSRDWDSDSDGIWNKVDADDDNDGVADYRDAYPLIALGGLTDFDNDGRPDDCNSDCQTLGMSADLDDDGDGMSDALESANGLNPLDSEDCPFWYCSSVPTAITLVASSAFDFDGDGLTRAQEESVGTNWRLADSDGDGRTDGDEVSRSSNPLSTDSDGDGLSDSREVELGTSPILADTDGDSMSDSEEIGEGLSPTDGSDCPRWYCGGLVLPAIIGTGAN